MSRLKKIGIITLLVLFALQFIRPARNNAKAISPYDMVSQFHVPANIAGVFKTSCFDCHSNNTRYPWYSNVQPIGWFLEHHIKQGKKELNFNEFAAYSQRSR